ncbi:hypothetical protein CXB51_036961 [Gossypium anomalum]|uniref:Pentatricopeptide repeat-containing protein n=1 Tax=Gossypium anomalum TaxID=47600 RepID=A0A8J5XZH9_9ROSI|nr:hypothetical protein CXB51_036961 [Gossypium anomalum]
MLKELEENGSHPNIVTYGTVINAFCKQGMLKEGLVVLSRMLKKGIEPNIYIYDILLEAFYKQRMLCRAEAMIARMKQQRIKFNVNVLCLSTIAQAWDEAAIAISR